MLFSSGIGRKRRDRMADLNIKYMGLNLRNPVIVGSSSMTSDLNKLKQIEEAGAGGVVLKSIFEEQIMSEVKDLHDKSHSAYHPEALDYINSIGTYHSRNEYLKLIENAKKAVSIPIIASLNCVSRESWINYAHEIEKAGADAIELNMFIISKNPKQDSKSIEDTYFDIHDAIRDLVKIPVALKISPFLTNLYNFAERSEAKEVKALVMFNRFYHFDMDIENIELTHGKILTSHEEMALALRWVTLLAGRYDFDIAATTGIHDSDAVIKQILAGATAVQIVSTLFYNGVGVIKEIIGGIESWMKDQGFKTIPDFRGKLSREKSENPAVFERFQYIKALTGIE
jgi:dihydroorotate dehydrogenase (fumarate)